MNTEFMNEEVVEVVEDLTPRASGGGLKGFGLGLAVAGLVYGGIKLVMKLKNKRKDILIYPRQEDNEEEESEVVEVQTDKKKK